MVRNNTISRKDSKIMHSRRSRTTDPWVAGLSVGLTQDKLLT